MERCAHTGPHHRTHSKETNFFGLVGRSVAEGKEHGYGIKFWPIVVDTKPQGGEQDIAAASSLPNATAGDGGEGAGGDTSDAGAGQGGDGEEGSGSRSAPHPASSSPQTKEPKTSIVEYDSYEGMWKDGWEHGVGKYTWYVRAIVVC